MNGVRRYFGAVAAATEQPETPPKIQTALPTFTPLNGPSWPPQSPETTSPTTLRKPSLPSNPSQSTNGPLPPRKSSISRSSISSRRPSLPTVNGRRSVSPPPKRPPLPTTSPPVPALSRIVTTLKSQSPPPRSQSESSESRRSSMMLNTKDDLLMSLLASEAIVDSRDLPILSSEQVEELKREQQVLTTRLEQATRKLALETKLRDAAASLNKVSGSKEPSEQLVAANARVEAAQKDLWMTTERLNSATKSLLEHRAGVLAYSVRSMEKKISPTSNGTNGNAYDSGYDTPGQPHSPTNSSMTGFSVGGTSRSKKFDGAQYFAGHPQAIVPGRRSKSTASARDIVAVLEEKLKEATDALTAAGKKQAELSRELKLLQLEKVEVETRMGMELQSAEEAVEELKKVSTPKAELAKLQEEKQLWESERARLIEQSRDADSLQTQLKALGSSSSELTVVKAQLEQKEANLRSMRLEWEADRRAWEEERTTLQDEKMEDLARLQDEMDTLREDDKLSLEKVQTELDDSLAIARKLISNYSIQVFSRDNSLVGLMNSIGTHLGGVRGKLDTSGQRELEWETARRTLEEEVRIGMDKREALVRELEEARNEREEARKEVKRLETKLKDNELLPPKSPSLGAHSVLQPIWAQLPSPEARAAKFGSQSKFRTGSPSPVGTPTSPSTFNAVKSLADLDVRSLKILYDNRQTAFPPSPNLAPFSLEAFAARVQALIQDDRALIERLIRFAQAHELLKKNADRAQKLAQESSVALETYQKQVRTLEERNMTISVGQAGLQDELAQLQTSVKRITDEKAKLEAEVAAQEQMVRELTEANNTLSGRNLALAEEAASGPELVKREYEEKLAKLKASLDEAQEEIDAMKTTGQTQRIQLLDELNTMQTENASLRSQLRTLKNQ